MRIPQAELGSALSALGSSALGWSLGVGVSVGGVFSARITTQTQCQMGFSEERKKIKNKNCDKVRVFSSSLPSLASQLNWRTKRKQEVQIGWRVRVEVGDGGWGLERWRLQIGRRVRVEVGDGGWGLEIGRRWGVRSDGSQIWDGLRSDGALERWRLQIYRMEGSWCVGEYRIVIFILPLKPHF